MMPLGCRLPLLLVLFGVLGTGCVSLSSMQTARTVQPGKVDGELGGGYEHIQFAHYDADPTTASVQKAIQDLPMPVIEGGVRVGLTSSLDVGARLAILPGDVVRPAVRQVCLPCLVLYMLT